MNKQYSCIVFCNESDKNNESVAEVPVIWLDETKTICKWPPSPSLVSLYINRYKIPMESWISYNVKVTATFATFEEARNFNKDENKADSSGRRLVKSPDIYSPDEFVEARRVKRSALPPNIDVALVHSNNGELAQSYSDGSQSYQDNNYPVKVYTLMENVAVARPKHTSFQSEDDVAVASGSHTEPNDPLMESGFQEASSNTHVPKEPVESCAHDKIINLLLDLKLEVGSLTAALREQGMLQVESDPILETLPLKNLEDFQSLEVKLDTDPVLKKKLYKTCESIGGNGSRDFVIRCLNWTFTNDMAELCSWTGQKDNYKVADSPLLKILYLAVKKTTGVSEKDFEICTKDWLRHAKQRKERIQKKINN